MTEANEKYCGDLVQKKTFTPDYLSHDKKYNKGEEEFVILKDHHEPIVSREMFDAANRILDDRSLSPEGKSKHSNRYCFSGKIKCGVCDGTFGARYTTRKDGSVYKAWRCLEAAQHGRRHVDKAGNEIGCTSGSIRNEDALHIMSLVAESLEMNKHTIIKYMINVIQSVVAPDTVNSNSDMLQEQIRAVKEKKDRLIELYMNKDITRDEFVDKRTKCEAKLEGLNELLTGIDKRNVIFQQQDELIGDITSAVNEIVDNAFMEEAFFRNLLDRMVIHGKDNIEVYLKMLPHKWRYALAKAMKLSGNTGCASGQDFCPPASVPNTENLETQSGSDFADSEHFRTRCGHIGNENVAFSQKADRPYVTYERTLCTDMIVNYLFINPPKIPRTIPYIVINLVVTRLTARDCKYLQILIKYII